MKTIIHHATLSFTSSLACVDPIEQLAKSFALLAGLGEHAATDIALATREATVNAIVHGNRGLAGKALVAELSLTAVALVIRISDQGAGFRPEDVADPLLEHNLLRSSGRGVFLMRQIMDDVHFANQSTGSTITLFKQIT